MTMFLEQAKVMYAPDRDPAIESLAAIDHNSCPIAIGPIISPCPSPYSRKE
jgi:hypothetical protein